MLAINRVVGRGLQRLHHIGVARDQVEVDLGDVATGDETVGCVAGCRHAVVERSSTLAHQRDHLVGGVAVLDVDLAAGLFLERRDPVVVGIVRAVLDVTRPRDQIQLALALPDRGGQLGA